VRTTKSSSRVPVLRGRSLGRDGQDHRAASAAVAARDAPRRDHTTGGCRPRWPGSRSRDAASRAVPPAHGADPLAKTGLRADQAPGRPRSREQTDPCRASFASSRKFGIGGLGGAPRVGLRWFHGKNLGQNYTSGGQTPFKLPSATTSAHRAAACRRQDRHRRGLRARLRPRPRSRCSAPLTSCGGTTCSVTVATGERDGKHRILEVIDVAQVAALLVAVRREVLGAATIFDPAESAGALADRTPVSMPARPAPASNSEGPGRTSDDDRRAVRPGWSPAAQAADTTRCTGRACGSRFTYAEPLASQIRDLFVGRRRMTPGNSSFGRLDPRSLLAIRPIPGIRGLQALSAVASGSRSPRRTRRAVPRR